jgi:hypothetical protein
VSPLTVDNGGGGSSFSCCFCAWQKGLALLPLPNPVIFASLSGYNCCTWGCVYPESWVAGAGCVLLAGLAGSRGGRAGLATCAAEAAALPLTTGADFTEGSGGFCLVAALLAANSCSLASRSRFVGGKGGRLAWLNAGGSFRASDPWLASDDTVRGCDKVDVVDLWETSEEVEPRLSLVGGCVDVCLGSTGAVCAEGVRLGRGGGALRWSKGFSPCEL